MMRRHGRRLAVGIVALAAVAIVPPCAADDTGSGVRFILARPVVDPALATAYEALMAGDTAAAESGYASVLRRDPRNADALHGMAAAALQRNDLASAAAFFERALEADPGDAAAYASLHGLGRQADPATDESRLKNFLAARPDQHALRFALGNLYAKQQRWHDAQQQFFLAHTGDPGQPDYLFNLAVALERLRKRQLAQEHYRMALAAAATRPARFDRGQAQAGAGAAALAIEAAAR